MLKKRLFLALIAASMSLAGCDKINNTIPVDNTPTDNPQDDPNKDSGDEGGEDGGDTDVDKLTPEQRENANSLKGMIELVLTLPERYENETIQECGEYTLAYAEELALQDVKAANLVSFISKATPLMNNLTAEAVVGLVKEIKEEDKLQDVAYFATAVGKSFLRAEEKSNEDYGKALGYLVDLMDEEGYKMHTNVYNVIDEVAGAAVLAFDADFTAAYNGAFTYDDDLDARQIDLKNFKDTIIGSANIILEVAKAKEGLKYLVNFLVGGVKRFANEVLEIDEETLSFIDGINTDDILDQVFGGLQTAAFLIRGMTNVEDGVVDYAVTIANLLFARKYMEALGKIVTDFLMFIGIESDELDEVGELASDTIGTIAGSISSVIASFVAAFTDKEGNSAFDPVAFKAAVNGLAAKLEELTELENNIKSLDEFLVKVVELTLVKVASYEEEEAQAVAAKFDFSLQIEDAFEMLGGVSGLIGDLPDEFFDGVDNAVKGEYAAAFVKFTNVAIYYALGFLDKADLYKDITDAIWELSDYPTVIIEHFQSDEFKTLTEGLVNEETHEVDVDKLSVVLEDVLGQVNLVIAKKAEVKAFIEDCVEVIEAALAKFGYEESQIEAMINEDEIFAAVDKAFALVEKAAEILGKYLDPEDHDYDVLATLIINIVNDIIGKNMIALVTDILTLFYTIMGVENPEDQISEMFGALALAFAVPSSVINSFTGDDFKDAFKNISDNVNNALNIEGLVAFVKYIGKALEPVETLNAGLKYFFHQVQVLYKAYLMTYEEYESDAADAKVAVFVANFTTMVKSPLNEMLLSYQMMLDGTLDEEGAQALVDAMGFGDILDVIFAYYTSFVDYLKAFGDDEDHYSEEIATLNEVNELWKEFNKEVQEVADNPELSPATKFNLIAEIVGEKGQELVKIQNLVLPSALVKFFSDPELVNSTVKALSFFFAFFCGEDVDGYEYADIEDFLPNLDSVRFYIKAFFNYGVEKGEEDIYPYLEQAAGIFAQIYKVYENFADEFNQEVNEYVALISVVFENIDLVEALLGHLFEAGVEFIMTFDSVDGYLDFSEMVYRWIFFNEVPLNKWLEEDFDALKLALADVYAIADKLGMAEKLVEYLGARIGGETEEIDTAEEFVDFVFDYISSKLVVQLGA